MEVGAASVTSLKTSSISAPNSRGESECTPIGRDSTRDSNAAIVTGVGRCGPLVTIRSPIMSLRPSAITLKTATSPRPIQFASRSGGYGNPRQAKTKTAFPRACGQKIGSHFSWPALAKMFWRLVRKPVPAFRAARGWGLSSGRGKSAPQATAQAQAPRAFRPRSAPSKYPKIPFFIGHAAENRFPLFLRALRGLRALWGPGGRGKGESFLCRAARLGKTETAFLRQMLNRVCRAFVRQGDACLESRDRALMIGAKTS